MVKYLLLIVIVSCIVIQLGESNSNAQDYDLAGSKGTNLFFVLGFLDEYSGRHIDTNSDQIEHFYWGEYIQAYVILAYLNKIKHDQGLSTDISVERRQELLISLHSDEMTKLINSFYESSRNSFFPYAQFQGRDRSLKLAYLAGAYFRYGRNSSFSFANSYKKAELVVRLLSDVGCKLPEIKSSEGTIPVNNIVYFEPTNELTEWFEAYPENWAFEAADSLVGIAPREELEIYRAVISVAQKGAFEGCDLSVPCITSRLSSIRGDGATNIPTLPEIWQEALDNHNERRLELVSLHELESDSILISNSKIYPHEICIVSLQRIGFTEDKENAIALLSYYCRNDYCYNRLAVFLRNDKKNWRITHYTIEEKRH